MKEKYIDLKSTVNAVGEYVTQIFHFVGEKREHLIILNPNL